MTHPFPRPVLWEMPVPTPDWGRVIAYRRTALGLSKTDLARAANVGRATIYDCERGAERVSERTRVRVLDTLDELEAAERRD